MADALIGERSAAAPPSPGAAAYVLTLLTLIGVVNWADRSIVAILLDPIKRDLHASDTQMGLLNGFGFAVFYAVAAIPIARLADRSSRRDVLAWSLLAWSVLTAACGLAQSFAMLLLARFGVGAGESAAAPVSQALIVDYFPPRRRPLALSVQSSSIYIGTTLSAILGGYLGYRFGWRTALVAIGAPGLVLAALLRLTVREPARGRLDPVGSLAGAAPGFFPALRPLLSQPAFVLTVAATTFGAVVNGAMAAWTPAFFGRVYHLNLKELGLAYGVVKGLTGIAGVLAGGWIAGRSGVGAPPRQLALCAAATLIAVPFFLAFAFAPGVAAGLVALGLFQLFTTMPLGVSYAVVQELAPPSTRALAAAVLALSSTLIGIGGGPLFIGVLTDALHAAHGAAAVKYALVWLVPFMLLGAGVYAAAARAAARRR